MVRMEGHAKHAGAINNLPLAMAAVDCGGDESSIAECQSNDSLIGMCSNITSSTVMACATTAPGCERQEGTNEGSLRLRGGLAPSVTPSTPDSFRSFTMASGAASALHGLLRTARQIACGPA
eukprot:jgi/Ulvmu1/8827/UM049_0007.1